MAPSSRTKFRLLPHGWSSCRLSRNDSSKTQIITNVEGSSFSGVNSNNCIASEGSRPVRPCHSPAMTLGALAVAVLANDRHPVTPGSRIEPGREVAFEPGGPGRTRLHDQTPSAQSGRNPIRAVQVNGHAWHDFDAEACLMRVPGTPLRATLGSSIFVEVREPASRPSYPLK